MLAALGMGPEEENVYTKLLDCPPLTLARLCQAGGWTCLTDVEGALAALEDKGLVSRMAGRPVRFAPVAPELALVNLMLDRQSELDRARATIAELSRRFQEVHRRVGAADSVEIVSSDQRVLRRIDLALRSARTECRVLDCPPYIPIVRSVPDSERDMLARGVRVRAVYDHAAIEVTGLDHLLEAHRLGEEARIVSELTVRLWLIDDRLALMPMKTGHAAKEGLLVVHPSALLDALSDLFERVWAHASPMRLNGHAVIHPGADRVSSNQAVLSLLAAGYTDSAIARNLGLGLRTVARRIQEIMRDVNAKTRFQAGMIVARSGLDSLTADKPGA
jgi:sugar-specific transcriptional regulator TrmB/DNA-binding CsgD family transcriptional regulator